MTPPTTFFLLIEKAIGQPLIEYLRELREDERSWPYIANRVAEKTGVEISAESLRRWYLAFSEQRSEQGSAA